MILAATDDRAIADPSNDEPIGGRTFRGLGTEHPVVAVDGRPAEGRPAERITPTTAHVAERWLALVDRGLVVVDAVPVLAVSRSDVPWRAFDDLEAHLLLRADAGCTLRELIEAPPYPRPAILDALGRLARGGVLRFAPAETPRVDE